MTTDPSSLSEAATKRRNVLLRLIWPATARGSFALAFLSWPVMLLCIDTFGLLTKDVFQWRDFGLAALDYISVPGIVFALVAWFRGFILWHDGPW